MTHIPEAMNRHYYQLFVRSLGDQIPLYSSAEKRFISPNLTAESVNVEAVARGQFLPPTVGQLGDFVLFSRPLPKEKTDPEVETVVKTFAQQLASAIETLVEETSHFGTPVCYDLFQFSDGSPNLQVNYVISDGATVEDPMASITGWIAYKVNYTVGIRHKR